jgi:hypothetical protein
MIAPVLCATRIIHKIPILSVVGVARCSELLRNGVDQEVARGQEVHGAASDKRDSTTKGKGTYILNSASRRFSRAGG